MKLMSFFLLLFLLSNISHGQSLETRAAQSPAIFASSVSISYGISPEIILDLDKLFGERGLSQKVRREKVLHLVAKYQQAKKNKTDTLTAAELIGQGITKDREVVTIMTSGPASPAIYALEQANVSYGISEKLFWTFYDILDRERISAEFWKEQFSRMFSDYEKMRKSLAARDDKMAREAEMLLEDGKFEEAKEVMKRRIDFNKAKQAQINQELAASYFEYGSLLKIDQKYDSIFFFYKQAANLDPHNTIYTNELGLIYFFDTKYDSAIIWFERSLTETLAQGFSDSSELAIRFNNLGLAWGDKGKHEIALEYYNKALAIVKEKDALLAEIYANLGLLWTAKEDFDLAQKYHERALQIDTLAVNPNYEHIAAHFNNLGFLSLTKEEYSNSIDLFKRALGVQDVEFTPLLSTVYSNLGNAVRAMGDLDQAVEYYTQALVLDTSLLDANHSNVGRDYSNLGFSWYLRGEYDLAIEHFQKVLQIDVANHGKHSPILIWNYNNLGAIWKEKAEYEKALTSLEKGILIAQLNELETFITYRLQFHKASTLWRMGEKKAAKLIFKRLEAYAVDNNKQDFLDEIKAELKR